MLIPSRAQTRRAVKPHNKETTWWHLVIQGLSDGDLVGAIRHVVGCHARQSMSHTVAKSTATF